MNVMHPKDRFNEEKVAWNFDFYFNTEFNKQMWKEWKKENKND